jgi:hypothetical protein
MARRYRQTQPIGQLGQGHADQGGGVGQQPLSFGKLRRVQRAACLSALEAAACGQGQAARQPTQTHIRAGRT